MQIELTENFADVVTNNHITKSEGWDKNALRPTRNDGQEFSEGRFSSRANKSAFSTQMVCFISAMVFGDGSRSGSISFYTSICINPR